MLTRLRAGAFALALSSRVSNSGNPRGWKETIPSLVTKDGGTLRTVLDARAYILALSKDRERRAQWQRAAELLLAQADVAETRPKP
jgi:hypothetical protein